MDDNKNKSTGELLAGAAATGKAVSRIAQGAAAGGLHGAAAAGATSAAKKWAVPIIAVLLLPVILLAMLPTIVFGPLLSDGTSDEMSGFVDDAKLTQNLAELNVDMSGILSEGLAHVLFDIEQNFLVSGCDEKEIRNPYENNISYNANAIVSQYCAYKSEDVETISKEELMKMLKKHRGELYTYTYRDETRIVAQPIHPEPGQEEVPQTKTVRIYTISYLGESHFADDVFNLSEDQKDLAVGYAQNLTILLGDGVYQGMPDDFQGGDVSYEGITFKEGTTEVVYFNQYDKRWANAPYGTDNIGGYGCGPTSMSIVVSSLTSETVDPPHMAQWAYENGYWCSGAGSYHSLIPGAAKAWGLQVEGCSPSEPQRIVDALSSGKLVVAIMGKGHFTGSGHFMVLRGVTKSGKILVADPASYERSQKSWDMSIILNEVSRYSSAGGPFWIIGK